MGIFSWIFGARNQPKKRRINLNQSYVDRLYNPNTGKKYATLEALYEDDPYYQKVICHTCGVNHTRKPPYDIYEGMEWDCPSCWVKKYREKYSVSFLLRANKKHSGIYDYSKMEYITAEIEVTITCPIHGDFKQLPKNHMKRGCPVCHAKALGENDNIIYFWQAVGERHEGRNLYKFGITSERRGTKRIEDVARAGQMNPRVIRMVKTKLRATRVENQLLKLGKNPQMRIFDGSTEFRLLTREHVTKAIKMIDAAAGNKHM